MLNRSIKISFIMLATVYHMLSYANSLHITNNIISRNPARGWYFNENKVNSKLKLSLSTKESKQKEKTAENKCKDPLKWTVDCGFLDPTTFGLSKEDAYAFEQKEYKHLLHSYSLYPNDTESVYQFQKFNMWVLNQAMTASYTWQFNQVQHPEVDANIQVPVSQFGIQLIKNIEQNSENEFWKNLKKTSFFVLITRSDNEFCQAQGSLMHIFEHETGMTVWNFSVDNSHLPNYEHYLNYPTLPKATKDAVLKHIKMDWLPALYLYLKPMQENKVGTWIRIASGITPLDEIKERTINFVESYRHAIVTGVGENQKITPDFSVNHLYKLADDKLGLNKNINGVNEK